MLACPRITFTLPPRHVCATLSAGCRCACWVMGSSGCRAGQFHGPGHGPPAHLTPAPHLFRTDRPRRLPLALCATPKAGATERNKYTQGTKKCENANTAPKAPEELKMPQKPRTRTRELMATGPVRVQARVHLWTTFFSARITGAPIDCYVLRV
eukprot:gene11704-biopygen9438